MRRAFPRALAAPLLAAALAVLPAPAAAQLFFASRPDPAFTIGPLTLRASVTETADAVVVDVLWSLVLPARVRADEIAQDLYLLWPGEVEGTVGKVEPALVRYVEERGFNVTGEGTLPLVAQSLSEGGPGPREQPQPPASYVVFVQSDAAFGLSPPATFIRIPWTPRLAEPGWLMDLRLRVRNVIKPVKATWLEQLVVGGKSSLTISFHEVRDRPMFPMYFAHRDRVVHLADAPSELVVNFAGSDRLKIDQVFPPTSIRRLSENLESTEVVSLFLDKSEGITPQHLAVQFGYFSPVQAWALVLIPALFFVLGQALGPMFGRAALRLGRVAAAHLHVSRFGGPRPRESGTILSREVLEAMVPGETTRAEVLRRCGPPSEETEQVTDPGHRMLVYRGRRMLPAARRLLGWVSTVHHWDVEEHEVRIALAHDVLRDVQALTRHYRQPEEPPATP